MSRSRGSRRSDWESNDPKEIRRVTNEYAKRGRFVPDGDLGGRSASDCHLELCEALGLDPIYVLFDDRGPDELKAEKWDKLIERVTRLVGYHERTEELRSELRTFAGSYGMPLGEEW